MKTLRIHPILTSALAAVLVASTTMSGDAQTYSIDHFTFAGGGGSSTGGVYALSGTIGQTDAGQLSGGNYAISGGFWSVVAAISTPGAPPLSITRVGNAVRVSWLLPASGFVLEQSTTLASPGIAWTPVPFPYQTNATQVFVEAPNPAGNRFYRLHKP